MEKVITQMQFEGFPKSSSSTRTLLKKALLRYLHPVSIIQIGHLQTNRRSTSHRLHF